MLLFNDVTGLCLGKLKLGEVVGAIAFIEQSLWVIDLELDTELDYGQNIDHALTLFLAWVCNHATRMAG